jgi:RNA polymerase sigma factor (sigma-70 family)
MTVEELFLSNLDVIERAARFVAHRARLSPEDADDLVSALRLRLIENDYAVLRKFEGRCSLGTYAASIAHRLFVDDWMHTHGRWRPSAEAKRLGEAAVLLEGLLLRDRVSIDEALKAVQRVHPMTKEEAEAIAARLPARGPRPRVVALDDEPEPAIAGDTVEEIAIDHERAERSGKANRIVRQTLSALAAEDRVAFCLHFGEDMRVAEVARAMQRDQKQLYRRLDGIMRRLREALLSAGVGASEARELIGGTGSHLEFGLHDAEIPPPRQAIDLRESGHEVPE